MKWQLSRCANAFAKLQIPSSNIQRSLKHQTSKQFVGARFWCLGFENSLELGWPARATAELVLGAFILSEQFCAATSPECPARRALSATMSRPNKSTPPKSSAQKPRRAFVRTSRGQRAFPTAIARNTLPRLQARRRPAMPQCSATNRQIRASIIFSSNRTATAIH